jgi:hypothetical protein
MAGTKRTESEGEETGVEEGNKRIKVSDDI